MGFKGKYRFFYAKNILVSRNVIINHKEDYTKVPLSQRLPSKGKFYLSFVRSISYN